MEMFYWKFYSSTLSIKVWSQYLFINIICHLNSEYFGKIMEFFLSYVKLRIISFVKFDKFEKFVNYDCFMTNVRLKINYI